MLIRSMLFYGIAPIHGERAALGIVETLRFAGRNHGNIAGRNRMVTFCMDGTVLFQHVSGMILQNQRILLTNSMIPFIMYGDY